MNGIELMVRELAAIQHVQPLFPGVDEIACTRCGKVKSINDFYARNKECVRNGRVYKRVGSHMQPCKECYKDRSTTKGD